MSPRRTPAANRPPTVAIRVIHEDRPEALPAILAVVAAAGGTVRTMSTVRRLAADGDAGSPAVETEIEIEGLDEAAVDADDRRAHPASASATPTRALDRIFGKRVIVVGGGAQIAQVALGAVSEADRHNLRGERISVDTIPLVGEANIAGAVRAVADLPRARLLVLAGSIMGGDISTAADELRAVGHPGHRPQHGRLDHRPRRPRRQRPGPGRHDGRHGRRRHGHVRPHPPARPALLSRAEATEPDAHRDLERQLAQGPPRQGGVVARAGRAGRPAHAGDEAHRRRRARSSPSGCSATSCSTTARGAGTGWRSRAGWGSRTSSRTSATGRCALSGAGGGAGPERPARRTSTRSARRGW